MSPPEIATLVKDVLLALAGATTAIVAVLGLQRWRSELHGKADFEVARSLGRATYRLRNALNLARSPLILSTEFPEGSAPSASAKKSAEDEANAYVHVFSRRWEPIYAALEELDTQLLEAEALWGSNIRVKVEKLRALVRKLRAAGDAYVSNLASGGEDFSSDREFGKQIRSEVFNTGSENALARSIAEAVQEIEAELRPRLKRA